MDNEVLEYFFNLGLISFVVGIIVHFTIRYFYCDWIIANGSVNYVIYVLSYIGIYKLFQHID